MATDEDSDGDEDFDDSKKYSTKTAISKKISSRYEFTEHLKKKLVPFFKHTYIAKHQAWAFDCMIDNLKPVDWDGLPDEAKRNLKVAQISLCLTS